MSPYRPLLIIIRELSTVMGKFCGNVLLIEGPYPMAPVVRWRHHRKIMRNHDKMIGIVSAICWVILIVVMEVIGLTAPGDYSGPFWSCNFPIRLWEKPKLLISIISGFGDVSPSPKTNTMYLWRRQDT